MGMPLPRQQTQLKTIYEKSKRECLGYIMFHAPTVWYMQGYKFHIEKFLQGPCTDQSSHLNDIITLFFGPPWTQYNSWHLGDFWIFQSNEVYVSMFLGLLCPHLRQQVSRSPVPSKSCCVAWRSWCPERVCGYWWAPLFVVGNTNAKLISLSSFPWYNLQPWYSGIIPASTVSSRVKDCNTWDISIIPQNDSNKLPLQVPKHQIQGYKFPAHHVIFGLTSCWHSMITVK